jgi:hypothetical protein
MKREVIMKGKQNAEKSRIVEVKIRKERFIKMINEMLEFFEQSDDSLVKDYVKVLGFGHHRQLWTGNYSDCLPFLLKFKAISIEKHNADSKALKGPINIVTIHKDGVLKAKKYLDSFQGKLIPTGKKKMVYGDKKNRRSFYL